MMPNIDDLAAQQGDEAWSLHGKTRRHRRRRNRRVPRPYANIVSEKEDGEDPRQNPGCMNESSPLRETINRKEHPTPHLARALENLPRTIANEAEMSRTSSDLNLASLATKSSSSSQRPSAVAPHRNPALEALQSYGTQHDKMASATEAKCVPPHLRKKTMSTPISKQSTSTESKQHEVGQQSFTHTSNTTIMNSTPITIDSMVHDGGKASTKDSAVDVTSPRSHKPLVHKGLYSDRMVTYNSCTKGMSASKFAPTPSNRESATIYRGRSGRVGRGGRGGRQAREGRWPKSSETRADPHRWDNSWNSHNGDASSLIKSTSANGGWGDGGKNAKGGGNGPEQADKLADWDKGRAPAPMNWDSRSAFRDGQSAERIDTWRNEVATALTGLTVSVNLEDPTVAEAAPPKPDDPLADPLGDIAPRYWVPIVFGRKTEHYAAQAPQTFWNQHLRSDPKPCDGDDLVGVKPWWQMYQASGSHFLQPYRTPEIKGIDPDESQEEKAARKNDLGSAHALENRKRAEKAKRDAIRRRAAEAQEARQRTLDKAISCPCDPIGEPVLKFYVRSAKQEDAPRLREIYNHYIDNTIYTPETQRRTNSDMQNRLRDVRSNNLPYLVACERGTKIPARQRKREDLDDDKFPDKVIGFAFADDFNDPKGMYRFTAEIEVFVDKAYYMKGVGNSLLDKLVGLLDPGYMQKGGYEIEGHDLYGDGAQRRIANIVLHLPYDNATPERLTRVTKWLGGRMEFRKVGELKEVGVKNGKRQVV